MNLIENNKVRPPKKGIYDVVYSDESKGKEYFNGNSWEVKYPHPVAYWKTTK